MALATSKLTRGCRFAGQLVSATARHLAEHERLERFKDAAQDWIYAAGPQLPEKYLVEVWPEIHDARAHVRMSTSHYWELPYGERAVLDAIVRHLRPQRLFEFGTFTGATTRLLADAAPSDAVVHTLDLPAAAIDSLYGVIYQRDGHISQMIGRDFNGLDEYRNRIISHRCNSREFDFRPFLQSIDFTFVDASHYYEDVVHDSKRALDIVAPGGLIVWDDYQPRHPGVVRALNELAADVDIFRVASSRLAVHQA